MKSVLKFSVMPLFLDSRSGHTLSLPYSLDDETYVDSIKGLFQPEHFLVWQEVIGFNVVEFFMNAETALIHRFYADYGIGNAEEASKDVLHKTLVCLRIVRPTRTSFAVVQYQSTNETPIDLFSLVEPENALSINMPESEVLNELQPSDCQELRTALPSFRKMITFGPANIRRAIRYYETGYVEQRSPDLQFTTWMTGIDALYANSDEPPLVQTIKERALQSIGPDRDIYEAFEDRDLYHADPVLVKDVIDEMFNLRERFVRGSWAPKSWFSRSMRDAIRGGAVNFVDVLREAASFILRAGIKAALTNQIDSTMSGTAGPDNFTDEIKSLEGTTHDYYSCFISYSHTDQAFAFNLNRELANRGISCWLDEKQLLAGGDIYQQIDRGIRLYDKLVLCCSRSSLTSWWVHNEIGSAFEKEQQLTKEHGKKVGVLIPLNLDNYLFSERASDGYFAEIRRRVALDFTGWDVNQLKLESQVEKLVRALRTDESVHGAAPDPKL